MLVDGVLYPLHLAIASDWKRACRRSAGMAHNAAYREEERHFLEDMAAVLGARAMTALQEICAMLALEYACGIDFCSRA